MNASAIAAHERLVQGLLRSSALPGGPRERIETHISSLVLAGDLALKLRKPVVLPFLDFSTVERRRTDCEEELRLNRRTAPDLYLDVQAVGGAPDAPVLGAAGGEPIDWLLRMRRFDDAALLDAMARRGALDGAVVDALARRVSAFHEALPPSPPGFGSALVVRRWAIDNIDALESRHAAGPERLAALLHWTEAACTRLAPLIEQRRATGRVREGHGDLHLRNIVLWQGEPLPFDAIEFNAELRHIDVVADMAFTFMDLLRHGLPGLAWRFASAWAEHGDDRAGLALLHFHAVYRALVRAKVAALRLDQGQAPVEAQAALALDLALAEEIAFGRHAAGPTPRLVLTSGLSGSGKSWLAQRLVERLGAVRLRSDVERKRLHGYRAEERVRDADAARVYGPAASGRTFAQLADTARRLLEAGLHVVVDAAFLRRAEREHFRAVAAAHGARFTLLDCRADLDVMRARIVRRAAEGHDPSDATPAVLDKQLGFVEAIDAGEAAFTIPTDQGDATIESALLAAFA